MTMRARRVMQAKLLRIQVNMYPVSGFSSKKVTFEPEFLALLKKAGVPYDPKYVLG
jgi:hypothetical protein